MPGHASCVRMASESSVPAADGDERQQQVVDADGAVVCGEDAPQKRWTSAAGGAGPVIHPHRSTRFAREASHASYADCETTRMCACIRAWPDPHTCEQRMG